jgi:hypothetical protein
MMPNPRVPWQIWSAVVVSVVAALAGNTIWVGSRTHPTRHHLSKNKIAIRTTHGDQTNSPLLVIFGSLDAIVPS